jgi:hypothetical protein
MAWALIDDDFPNHPKVAEARAAEKDAGWLYVCALCYCRKYHTGGFVPRPALNSLGAGNVSRRLVDALVAVGLWDSAERGFQIHDYERIYSDDADKALKESRRESGRRGGIESSRLNKVATACAAKQTGVGLDRSSSDQYLEETKREADFANFWQAYPKKDGKQVARKCWMKLAPDDDTQRAIAADIDRRSQSAQWLKDGGQFIPHASTYLNGRRWEDGFTERPRLAERTINVIKGFGDAKEETA